MITHHEFEMFIAIEIGLEATLFLTYFLGFSRCRFSPGFALFYT